MSDNAALVGAQDQSSNVTEYNGLSFIIQQHLTEVDTATLGKVVRAPYDKDGKAIPPGTVGPIGYVDVQPMVNQLDGRGQATPHGTVYRLSYFRYQGGDTAVIFDPAVGDIGKLVVANRDTSSVRATDKPANPGSRRKFDLADGTFFPKTQAKAPVQWISSTDKGMIVHDRNNNEVVLNDDGIKVTDSEGNQVVIVKSGNVITISAKGTVNVNAPSVVLAGGGPKVARVGDTVVCPAGEGHIVSGSKKTQSG